MNDLEHTPGIEQTNNGYFIPATASLEEPLSFVELIRHQIRILEEGGNASVLEPIPNDEFPETVLWARGDTDNGNLAFCRRLEPLIMGRPIDRYAENLWRKLYASKKINPSVSPIYISPSYHEGDQRSRHLSNMYIEHLTTGPMVVSMGGSQGNNAVELKKGFEVASTRAAIISAVRVSRCLDLRGIQLSFQDKTDDCFYAVLGERRERISDATHR